MALREFRLGMWRAFDADELRVISECIDNALDSLDRQNEELRAEAVAIKAREAMGPDWGSGTQWYLDVVDKIDAASQHAAGGLWEALVTMATFTPRHSELTHFFSHVDDRGRVHSVCKTFKPDTDLERVKATLGTITGSRQPFRFLARRDDWYGRCAQQWYPAACQRWLPPQAENARAWKPQVHEEEEEDPLDDILSHWDPPVGTRGVDTVLEPDLQELEEEISSGE